MSEINMAQRELVAALRTFRHLKSLSKALGWDTDRVGKHVDYIQQHALKDTEVCVCFFVWFVWMFCVYFGGERRGCFWVEGEGILVGM